MEYIESPSWMLAGLGRIFSRWQEQTQTCVCLASFGTDFLVIPGNRIVRGPIISEDPYCAWLCSLLEGVYPRYLHPGKRAGPFLQVPSVQLHLLQLQFFH